MTSYDDGNDQSNRAGNAAKSVAKKGAKKSGKSAGKKLLILLGVKGILWVLVIGLILLVIAAAAGAISQQTAAAQPSASVACGGTPAAPVQPVSGSAPGLTAEQNSNAQAIVATALSLGLGYQGALIGVLEADIESDLVAVNFGDMVGPGGSMSSSRGLYQQISAWGPLADRMDPVKSATMFFTGGQAGQKGLTSVQGWQSMAPEVAGQQIQQSEYSQLPGHQSPGLAAKLALATTVTKALTSGQSGGSAAIPVGPAVPVAASVPCPPAAAIQNAAAIIVNGVAVTIPDNQYVTPALRGKVLTAPNAGIAKGLAAGFGLLGTDYVWGGSGADGTGPDNGCSRGGGALNSHCSGGPPVGIDCSGLSAYVIVQGGFPGPGTNSDAQRHSGTDVPWAQGLPGDIVGFPGHVAVYLANISGMDYILEASDIGIPLHVVPLTRTDHDAVLHRHWS